MGTNSSSFKGRVWLSYYGKMVPSPAAPLSWVTSSPAVWADPQKASPSLPLQADPRRRRRCQQHGTNAEATSRHTLLTRSDWQEGENPPELRQTYGRGGKGRGDGPHPCFQVASSQGLLQPCLPARRQIQHGKCGSILPPPTPPFFFFQCGLQGHCQKHIQHNQTSDGDSFPTACVSENSEIIPMF